MDWHSVSLRIQRGETDALKTVMQAYWEPLTYLAFQLLGSRDAAQDVVQDVFVGLWQQRAMLDPDRSIRALLYRSVRNRALNELKYSRIRDQHHLRVQDDTENGAENHSVPSDEDAILAHTTYETVLGLLSERFRLALRLRFEEQLSYEELAEVLELTPNAAMQLVLRARTALRNQLAKKSRP